MTVKVLFAHHVMKKHGIAPNVSVISMSVRIRATNHAIIPLRKEVFRVMVGKVKKEYRRKRNTVG
jgi:hypothetical protein